MREEAPMLLPGKVLPAFTPRSLLAVIFRRRRAVAIAFAAVFGPILLAVIFLPGDFVSETKILVERQRFDPVITSMFQREGSGSDLSQLARLGEQDIDSEIDLLESEDLLRQVVISCGLWKPAPWRARIPIGLGSQEKRIAVAEMNLRKNLTIDPPNKSNIVKVRYRSHKPAQSAQVLQALTNAYLEKHLQVHRPAGSSDFFSAEVEHNRRVLQEAQARLVAFTQREGVVSARTEAGTLLTKIADFDAALQNTNVQIASVKQRIENLKSQLATVKPRITTEVKTASLLLETLKTTLHSLELKRSELLTKFQPTYRLVVEVDKQIAETRAAITAAEQAPTIERTTDQDPVYIWLNSEVAKARSERSALQATAARMERTLQEYHGRAIRLEELGEQQEDLLRSAKTAEEAYLAAVRKQSEARMSEALDRSRIMNVAVAQPPTVPVLPTVSSMMRASLAFGLALIFALGLAFALDYWDPSFRTPYELETCLNVAVLAAIPYPNAIAAASASSAAPRLLGGSESEKGKNFS